MLLNFSRISADMEFFRDSNSFTVEALMDLMSDLYSDIAEGMHVKPEACESEDADAMVANLIWLGTLFQKIHCAQANTIAQANSAAVKQLSDLKLELDQQLGMLDTELEFHQNEKLRLEEKVALQEQKNTELEELEAEIQKLQNRSIAAEKTLDEARTRSISLKSEIVSLEAQTKEMDDSITEELQPRLRQATTEKNAKQSELDRIFDSIEVADGEIKTLKKQIRDMRKNLEDSNKMQIIKNLEQEKIKLHAQEKKIEETLRQKKEVEQQCENLAIKNDTVIRELQETKKKRQQLDEDMRRIQQQYKILESNEANYIEKRMRFNELKSICEQLRIDSAHLCKRTEQDIFALDEELYSAMEAINGYLNSVGAAIRKYTQKTEQCL